MKKYATKKLHETRSGRGCAFHPSGIEQLAMKVIANSRFDLETGIYAYPVVQPIRIPTMKSRAYIAKMLSHGINHQIFESMLSVFTYVNLYT